MKGKHMNVFFLYAATHPKWSRTQKGRVAIPGIGIFAEAPSLVFPGSKPAYIMAFLAFVAGAGAVAFLAAFTAFMVSGLAA